MDLNSTIDIIIKDLQEAREIIDDLKNYPGVPLLQIELAKSKCRSAGEVIELLKNVPEITVPKKEEKIETRKVINITKGNAENKVFTNEIPVEKEIIVKKVIAEEIKPEKQPEIKTKEVKDVKVAEIIPKASAIKEEIKPPDKKPDETSILADQFICRQESLYEKMESKNQKENITEIYTTKPVVSLSDAIGLNDKFLFIREIFDGNSEVYNQVISKLDGTGNFNDAKTLLYSYVGESTDNDAVIQLMDLLKRKFPQNE